tara:strand:- start:3375 stop:4067 length:693 start_codon:yes stop_codon:yes gene_type:complete
MSDTFISQENKEFIWQMLMDANAFIGIPNNYFDRIQNIYEKLFEEISIFSNLSLKEKNKLVLSKMAEKIKFFSSKSIKKPLEEVSIDINNEFNNRKEEIMELTKHKQPTDISFNDQEDKPLSGEELNTKLNTIIASREYEMKQSLADMKIETVNPSKKVTFTNLKTNLDSNITLGIKEEVKEEIKEEVKEDINKRILNLLDIINKNQQLAIQNQDTIVSQLKIINSIIKQ